MVRREARHGEDRSGVAISSSFSSAVQDVELHCEHDRGSSFRLFLMQDGRRVSASSSSLSKTVRDLILNQSRSLHPDRDFIDFLQSEKTPWPLHVHSAQGVYALKWESATPCSAKTLLELAGKRIRVSRVLCLPSEEAKPVSRIIRLGERLAGDLDGGRLFYIQDVSGWDTAESLTEAASAGADKPDEQALRYESEEWAEGDGAASFEFASVSKKPAPEAGGSDEFPVMEPFEVSFSFFNDRKISFPTDQRHGYLKDIRFQVNGATSSAGESALTYRVTLVKPEASAWNASIKIKAACLWDNQWYGFGEGFFKYFEHLHFLRSPGLRKKSVRTTLAKGTIQLLNVKDKDEADRQAVMLASRLGTADAQSRWEAEEYLKRFHKTFIQHSTDTLLADANGFWLISMDYEKLGWMIAGVQELFSGDMVSWAATQEKEITISELFSNIKALQEMLAPKGIQLYYKQRQIRRAAIQLKVDANRGRSKDWFELHPQVMWDGNALTPDQWRSILENQGIWDEDGQMWILEDVSRKSLELLHELMRRPFKKNPAENEKIVYIPRLQVLDWFSLKGLGAEVRIPEESEAMFQRLLRFTTLEPKKIPAGFKGQLRDYQKEGYDWLAFLYEHGLGGCLADDMGLGKTIQAIAFIGGIKENIIRRPEQETSGKKHLIVLPTTLLFNWRNELKTFFPDLKVVEYEGGSASKKGYEEADVILTTYDTLRRYQPFFQSQKFHTVIFDEAQYLKNISAKRTASARRLKSDFVLTLTGTPLENHLGEYYSILDLSVPGLMGDYEEFRKLSMEGPLDRVKARAKPFVLRRTKDKALKELPDKTENEVYLQMSGKQKALYQKVAKSVQKDIERAFEKNSASQASLSALTALLRLRQVCVSPKLLDSKLNERSPKIDFLIDKLHELVDEEHSCLVFSQFTSFLDVLEEELIVEKLDYLRMDGSTPKPKRKALVDAFQCGAGAPIFLISLKTGGVGLNLTRASYVFHLDPWWNPAVENQASDRVHRIGQKKNVFITRLLMEHSVESKMMTLKQQKTNLYREVLESASVRQHSQKGLLTREDFDFLLSSK